MLVRQRSVITNWVAAICYSNAYSPPQASIVVLNLILRREWSSNPPGCEASDPAAQERSSLVVSPGLLRSTSRSSSTESLWQEYFQNPSGSLGNINNNESLWMEGMSKSGWVKDMAQGTHGINYGKPTCLHAQHENACSSFEDPDECTLPRCKAKRRSEFLADASKVQPRQESIAGLMPSLGDAFGILDQTAEQPSVDNFISALQKCRKNKDLLNAKLVHAYICSNGLEGHITVGNYIVPMFVECGSLSDAQQVFNRLVHRSEHSWTSLILGYIQCDQLQHALNLYKKMQENNVHPSSFTLMPLLKTCGMLKDAQKGRRIHADISQRGFERDLVIGNALVSMYAKCGSLSEAQEVFDSLPARDVVSWTAVITGYVENGPAQVALKCFQQMQWEGISPNAITFVCFFKACGSIQAIDEARNIHKEIRQKGFEKHPLVGSSLFDMYVKCGSLSEAREVFDKLPDRQVALWTALIAGYAEHGPGQEALKCFEQMQQEGIASDAVTFLCILKACASIRAIDKGRDIHMEITRKGCEGDLVIGSTLVSMYARCGSLPEARDVFIKLPIRDVVSWNALISGYAEHGPCQEVFESFEQMQLEGTSPDATTFVCILKACGIIESMDKSQAIHTEIMQKSFEGHPLVGNALVDMYYKCNSIFEAQEVFYKLSVQDVVSWTTLIAGYVESGSRQEALECFEQMQFEGVSPNAVTFVCTLKACGSAGAIDKGQEVHSAIIQRGFDRYPSIGNTLIDMYAKLGSLSEAQEIFDKLPAQDVVSWNALIGGYSTNREDNIALKCFEDMQKQFVKPNAVTFTCLLTACSHANLVSKGQKYFKVMKEDYGIAPTIDHYTCMIDLLARSGHLYEAERFLDSIPFPLSKGTWRALLSGCKTYGEPELGLRCFRQIVQINPEDASSYLLLSDIYTNAGRQDDARRIEELRKHAGVKKKVASSLIEVNKKVHEFVVGNNQSEDISALLENLILRMEEEGHVPNLDLVLRPISDEEKGAALCEHSEKLAIAFGLLNTPQGQTLRVTKNLRMCNDCHNASKIISRVERREIIIRDICCVHHFKEGLCSCGDMF